MMMKKIVARLKILPLVFWLILALMPARAYAQKTVTFDATTTVLETTKDLYVQININTDGEKVGAVGFSIDFSTELLEGLVPSQTNSVFPMCATLTATRYDCGITGKDGFSGNGTVTTLHFKGRNPGDTSISIKNFEARFGPTGTIVDGFTSLPLNIVVFGEGKKPPPPVQNSSSGSSTVVSSSDSNSESSPKITPLPATPATNLPAPVPNSNTALPTKTESQVPGLIGSLPETPLQPADSIASNPAVKGIFGQNMTFLGIIPTLFLLILVTYLAMKLFFTEKRRHLEVARVFDTQMAALAALESKIDIFDQKGEGNKEKFIAEFEQAKKQLEVEVNAEMNPAHSQQSTSESPPPAQQT